MKWVRRLCVALLAFTLVASVLAGIALVALNTAPGRDWVKDQIAALTFENGLRVDIEAIDGSLYSDLRVRGLTLSDPQGVFVRVPDLALEWSPFGFLWGHLDISRVSAPSATLSRVPVFAETAPSDGPLLPDTTISIDEFAIERIVVGEAVAGSERIASLEASVQIEDRRADLALSAQSVANAFEAAQGDVVQVALSAAPEDNRLDLDLDLTAPADGVIAAMTGLAGPLDATLKGEGTWADWKGLFTADWQERPFASLDLTASDGVFRATGETQLANLAPKTMQSALQGPSALDAEMALGEKVAQVSAKLIGAALRVETAGALTLEEGDFDDLRTRLTVTGPAQLTPEFSGADLEADITLDGEFARPKVIYDLRASQLNYAGLGLSGFSTAGETRVDPEEMHVPIEARAVRVIGLDQATGGPLKDLALTGDILIQWPRFVSDNLRLRSRRLNAGLTLVADAEAGRYGGAIDGKLGDYRLESVGQFDVASGARLQMNTSAGVNLAGSVRARSTRISNAGVQSLVGGETAISTDVAYQPNGVTRLSNLRLSSLLLSVNEGGGTYGANGALDIMAKGQSVDYGPLAVQLTGTIANPEAVIDAPSPGVGLGLANVTATVRSEDQLYRIEADGMSDLGAFSAIALADFSGGPSRYEITSGELGGVALSGTVRQTPDGLFAGALDAQGRGLSGRVQLASKGGLQTARITASARNMRLPGAAGLTIGQG